MKVKANREQYLLKIGFSFNEEGQYYYFGIEKHLIKIYKKDLIVRLSIQSGGEYIVYSKLLEMFQQRMLETERVN